MALIARVVSLIRNLTRQSRTDRAFDEELRATVDLLAAEKMRAGYTPDAARRAALVELGGIESIKEQVRDVRSGAMLDTLGQDIRYAARLLRRYPLFALTAALSLAVGIGANTAVFTIGNSLQQSRLYDSCRRRGCGHSLSRARFRTRSVRIPATAAALHVATDAGRAQR